MSASSVAETVMLFVIVPVVVATTSTRIVTPSFSFIEPSGIVQDISLAVFVQPDAKPQHKHRARRV